MTLTMIVEWSLGSLERYNWDGEKLIPRNPPWPAQWGVPPVNYGLIPGYYNPTDGGELDAIWASSKPLEVGRWLEGEVLGMIWLNDNDHKIILGELGSLDQLDYQGLDQWFIGREPRFTSTEEALVFIQSLQSNA
jgi:inorganic pyrophosphatase